MPAPAARHRHPPSVPAASGAAAAPPPVLSALLRLGQPVGDRRDLAGALVDVVADQVGLAGLAIDALGLLRQLALPATPPGSPRCRPNSGRPTCVRRWRSTPKLIGLCWRTSRDILERSARNVTDGGARVVDHLEWTCAQSLRANAPLPRPDQKLSKGSLDGCAGWGQNIELLTKIKEPAARPPSSARLHPVIRSDPPATGRGPAPYARRAEPSGPDVRHCRPGDNRTPSPPETGTDQATTPADNDPATANGPPVRQCRQRLPRISRRKPASDARRDVVDGGVNIA